MTQLNSFAAIASSLLLLTAITGDQASAQVLVEFDPVGAQGSTVPLFPTSSAPTLTATELMQTGFGAWGNTNVWPVGKLGVASPTLDPAQYLSFTVNAPSMITYDSLTYSRQSYLGDGNRAAAVRTSVDNFVSDVAVVTGIDPAGFQQIDFDLTGMTPTLGLVEFRVYFYDAPIAGDDWVDLLSTAGMGTGLVLNGDVMNDVGVNYCTPVANSTGAAGSISATGSANVAANDLALVANDLPLNSFGYLLTSQVQGNVPTAGTSLGTLCLGGSIGRYIAPGDIMNSGTTGSIAVLINNVGMPTPTGPISAMPGDTWNFQFWHRDSVNGMLQSNFTDGLEVLMN